MKAFTSITLAMLIAGHTVSGQVGTKKSLTLEGARRVIASAQAEAHMNRRMRNPPLTFSGRLRRPSGAERGVRPRATTATPVGYRARALVETRAFNSLH